MRPRNRLRAFVHAEPDYFLPTTACIRSASPGAWPRTCGALDFNLGCSGYVYGTVAGQRPDRERAGEAPSCCWTGKNLQQIPASSGDKAVRTVFETLGPTLIGASESQEPNLGICVWHGRSGAANLMVKTGAARYPRIPNAPVSRTPAATAGPRNDLYMNGPEIFSSPSRPCRLRPGAPAKAGVDQDAWISGISSGQSVLLDHLRKKIGIPVERFVVACKIREYRLCTIPNRFARSRDIRPADQGRVPRSGRVWRGLFLGRHSRALGRGCRLRHTLAVDGFGCASGR